MTETAHNVTHAVESPATTRLFAPSGADANVARAHVEAFCRAYIERGSWGAAYRATFDVVGVPERYLWSRAYEFAQRWDVRECLDKLFDDARKQAIISVNGLLKRLALTAMASPAGLTWITTHACRFCHGVGGAYQWRDYDEWATTAAKAFDETVRDNAQAAQSVRLPTDEGGYGYTMHRAPNPECETCAGAGLRITHVKDRDQMTEAEHALFKGVKQKADGSIEVLMHDQLKAAELCGRILGAFNDKVSIIPPHAAPDLPKGTTPEQVQQAYLSLVGG